MIEQLLTLILSQFAGLCIGMMIMYLTSRPKLKSDITVTSMRAGHNHLQLSWQDEWPILGFGSVEYIILRKEGLLSPWREITATRKMSVVDTGVVSGKQYHYKVCGSREAIKGNSFRASDRLKVIA